MKQFGLIWPPSAASAAAANYGNEGDLIMARESNWMSYYNLISHRQHKKGKSKMKMLRWNHFLDLLYKSNYNFIE